MLYIYWYMLMCLTVGKIILINYLDQKKKVDHKWKLLLSLFSSFPIDSIDLCDRICLSNTLYITW